MSSERKGQERVQHLMGQLTLDEKLQLLHGQMFDPYRGNQAGFVRGIDRLGIPDIFICDGESGINTSWDATALPAKVALAATFDENAAYDYGQELGLEAKACGMNVVLSPRVNIVRDNVTAKNMSNGGNFQTYSEDPLLNGLMGAAEARGTQKDHNAIANLKQMFGSSSGTAQGAGNCMIDEQTMHEIYMKPFEAVIRAGVGCNMTNYNQVNGTWTYKYFDMTQKLCRDQWGFEGFTVDDWLCLYEPEAICGGVTLEMPGSDHYDGGNANSIYGEALKRAMEDPKSPVSLQDIDRAVGYYLATLERFQMLDQQRVPGPLDEAGKKRGAEVARDIARRGAVLLKNEGEILPLDPNKGNVAIIGPTGGQQVMPIFKESAYGFAERRIGTAEALRRETNLQVSYAVGEDLEGTLIPNEYLRDADGVPGGLTLDVVGYVYPLLEENSLEGPLPSAKRVGRGEGADYTGPRALPVPPVLTIDPAQYPNPFRMPEPYYMWTGSIEAPETGRYRLTMHMSMPGVEVFERKGITSKDMAILSTGNLYLKQDGDKRYSCIGEGIRTTMNGGAVPHSEVLPTKDGFNNVGGFVDLVAGHRYEFIALSRSIYKEPVEARLCWVTPSQAARNVEEAVQIAKEADVAIVFGWHKTSETLHLPGDQEALIERVAAANPRTVVVLNNGDPVVTPWADKVPGILEMWYSGQEGALATVDVLCGRYNPAGRLPVTFPKRLHDTATHEGGHPERFNRPGRVHDKDWVADNVARFTEGILMGYRHFDALNIEPAYAFGFGLSYTTFKYSDLAVTAIAEGGLEVSCKVRNIGDRNGEEVVQCYITRPETVPDGVQAAPQALAAFQRIPLKAGESKQVILRVDAQSLCYWKVLVENNKMDEGEGWERLTGKRIVRVGASSRDIRLEQAVEIR